jgi:hypothetical protein
MSKRPATYDDPPDAPYDPPDVEQQPPEQPPEKPPLDRAEAEALLRAGTRLYKRGDDPKTHWVSMTRVGDQLAICVPATDEAIAAIVEQELLVAE